METALGRGYSINEESGLTDFYSPPSSIVDEDEELDDDLFYPEEAEEEAVEDHDRDNHQQIELGRTKIFPPSFVDEIKEELQPSPIKLVSTETTPPPTPLIPRRLLDPINLPTIAFQSMTLNSNLPTTPSRSTDLLATNWLLNTPSTNLSKTTSLLTPTSMDRYLMEQRRLSDSIYQPSSTLGITNRQPSSMSVQHTEVTNETSRLYSYMSPVDLRTTCATSSNSWSTFDDTLPHLPQVNTNHHHQHHHHPPYSPAQLHMKSPSTLNNSLYPPRVNPFYPNSQPSFNHHSSEDPWILSELSTILRQNSSNSNQISLSAIAQQILAANPTNNNRPLRSEKIDTEVFKHLILEANWKRQCGMKKEVCVFCRNNGENELIYSSHSLKDSMGNVTCPILRAYQCPICGATGSQAHTIKYCQASGEEHNRHVPTPYEKMLRMQTYEFEEPLPSPMPTFFGQLSSPSSLYTNGWSNSYL